MRDQDPKEPGIWGVLLVGAIGGAVLLGSYLHLRHGFVVAQLKDHADLGNALAPMVAFLTLLAVVAALWSVQVQRAELALQRKELQETRDEMVEQRKQFEKTAAAQEALVRAQDRQGLAQRAATVAALQAALVPLRVEWAKLRIVNQEKPFEESITSIESKLKALLANATGEYDEFAERMRDGRLDDD